MPDVVLEHHLVATVSALNLDGLLALATKYVLDILGQLHFLTTALEVDELLNELATAHVFQDLI